MAINCHGKPASWFLRAINSVATLLAGTLLLFHMPATFISNSVVSFISWYHHVLYCCNNYHYKPANWHLWVIKSSGTLLVGAIVLYCYNNYYWKLANWHLYAIKSADTLLLVPWYFIAITITMVSQTIEM